MRVVEIYKSFMMKKGRTPTENTKVNFLSITKIIHYEP